MGVRDPASRVLCSVRVVMQRDTLLSIYLSIYRTSKTAPSTESTGTLGLGSGSGLGLGLGVGLGLLTCWLAVGAKHGVAHGGGLEVVR